MELDGCYPDEEREQGEPLKGTERLAEKDDTEESRREDLELVGDLRQQTATPP